MKKLGDTSRTERRAASFVRQFIITNPHAILFRAVVVGEIFHRRKTRGKAKGKAKISKPNQKKTACHIGARQTEGENKGKTSTQEREETTRDVCKSDWGIGRLTIEPKKDKTVAHCSNVRTGSSIKEEEARENKAKKGNRRTTYTWRLGRTKGGETEKRYACASEVKNNSIHRKEKTLLFSPGRRGRVGVYRCIYRRCVSTRWQKPVRSGR